MLLDPGLSERDRQLGLEHLWDGLGEEKIGETMEIAIDRRLLAHAHGAGRAAEEIAAGARGP